MQVFLSCDVRNTFFVNAVREAIEEYRPRLPTYARLELLYPPLNLGTDTGDVVANVIQIQEADIVIFDVTPWTRPKSQEALNAGVMIEFGIFTALDHWPLRLPKPVYRVFRESRFPRRNVATPLLAHVAITKYTTDEPGKNRLKAMIRDILDRRLGQRIEFSTRPEITTKSTYTVDQIRDSGLSQ